MTRGFNRSKRLNRLAEHQARGGVGHQYVCEKHCRTRLRQRYGVLDPLDQGLLIQEHLVAVKRGRLTELGTREDGSIVAWVLTKGRRWYFAFDREHGLILTYLTERQAWRNVDREGELNAWLQNSPALYDECHT